MNNRSNNFLLLACLGLICLLGLASYFGEQSITQRLKSENKRELVADLDAIEYSLRAWFTQQKASATVWANTSEVRGFARRLNQAFKNDDDVVQALVQLELRHWLSPVHTGRGFKGYIIIAQDGTVLSSNFDDEVGTRGPLRDQPEFMAKILQGEAVISLPRQSGRLQPTERLVRDDKTASMFVGAPVLDDQGKVMAGFAFRIDPEADFSAIFNRDRTGDSGESFAYREDGVVITHSRFVEELRATGRLKPDMAAMFNLNLFLRDQFEIADQGEELNPKGVSNPVQPQLMPIPFYSETTKGGTVTDLDGYLNYRGEMVIAARRWLVDYDFGIVEEAAMDEKYALLIQIRRITWALTGFAILLMAALAYIILSGRYKILESQQRLSGIIEMADEAIISIDEAEAIILFNPAAQSIFGYSEEEMLGQPLSVLIPKRFHHAHHEHVKMFAVYWETVIRKTSSKNLVGVRKNGEEFPIEATVTRQQAGGKKVLTAAVRDISQRLKDQAALRREQGKAKRYLDTVEALILAIDNDGVVQLINRKGREMLGLSEIEIVGKSWSEFSDKNCSAKGGSSEDTDDAFHELTRGEHTGSIYHEGVLRSHEGENYIIGWHSSVLRDEHGEITGVLCGGIDLTSAKQSETERDRLQHQLMRAAKSEAIGQLTGGIAHDFNNMLAAISGYTELSIAAVEAGDDSEKIAKLGDYLQQVHKTCGRAAGLVSKLLAFSRGEESELGLMPLEDVVDSALKMLASVLPSSIEIKKQIDSKVEDILADPVQLEQVVVNLCINARDAMDGKGYIELGIREVDIDYEDCVSCHKPMSGKFVELSVRDDGPGINPKMLDNIFDPFFTTKDVGKGTGLGLSIAHGIIHGHNGHIRVESHNSGTVFRLYFPAVEQDDAKKLRAESRNRKVSSKKEGVSGHVLLVDDEAAVVNMLKEVLKITGLTVTSYVDSQAALEAFESAPEMYDLLLTDQTMPHLTGIELAKAVLAIRPDLPIVLCSGYSTAVDERSALNMGIRSYFDKPMDTVQLIHEIVTLLNIKLE